jgi:hypothetical protein
MLAEFARLRARGAERREEWRKLRKRRFQPMKLAMDPGFVSGPARSCGAGGARAQVCGEDRIAQIAHRPLGQRLRRSHHLVGVALGHEHDSDLRPAQAELPRDRMGIERALVEDEHVGSVPLDEPLSALHALRELDQQSFPRKQEACQLEKAGVRRRDENTYHYRAVCRDFRVSAFGGVGEGIRAEWPASSLESTAALDLSVGRRPSRVPGRAVIA